MAEKVDSYGLDASFERSVALLCASSTKFFGQVGHAIEPDGLDSEAARLIVKVAQEIHKATGRGPSNASVVMQRLRRRNGDGKITKKQINQVMDLLIDADMLPEQEVREELVPILKRRIEAGVVRKAMSVYSENKDMEGVVKEIQRANSLGIQDSSAGLRLGKAGFDEIDRVRRVHKLPLGIPDLDVVLRGGPPRGTLTMFVAGPGGGKSLALSHVAAYNLTYGMFVGYATLELPEVEVIARVTANITGIPTTDIAGGDFKEARKELKRMHPILGTFLVHHFSPKATTFADIADWVEQCEDLEGRQMDMLVVDYVDKLRGRNPKDNEYITQGQQTEEYRIWCESNGRWGATASQATIKGRDTRKRIQIGDVRDSSRKVDVADLVVTLTKDPSGEMIEYFVGKNRYGPADIAVGPLPHAWEYGRMVVP